MGSREAWSAILAIVVYSGPFFPLLATLLVPHAPRDRRISNIRRFALFSSIQALAFVPFAYGLLTHEPDAVHALYLPFFTGAAMFLGALIYAASEFGRRRRERHATNDA